MSKKQTSHGRQAVFALGVIALILGLGVFALNRLDDQMGRSAENVATEDALTDLGTKMHPEQTLIQHPVPMVPETVTTVATATTVLPVEVVPTTTLTPTSTTEPLRSPMGYADLLPNQPFGEVRIPRFAEFWLERNNGEADFAPLLMGNDADEDQTALLAGLALRPSTFPGDYVNGIPGTGSNSAIGGHRNSENRWFNQLNTLIAGDTIEIRTIWGVTYTYEVFFPAVEVTKLELGSYYPHQGGPETLVLFTCEEGTAKRLVVEAVLKSAVNS